MVKAQDETTVMKSWPKLSSAAEIVPRRIANSSHDRKVRSAAR